MSGRRCRTSQPRPLASTLRAGLSGPWRPRSARPGARRLQPVHPAAPGAPSAPARWPSGRLQRYAPVRRLPLERDEDYLLLFLRDPPTALIARELEGEALRLEAARAWTVEAPQIVDVALPGRRSCGCGSSGPATLGLTLLVPSTQVSKRTPGLDEQALRDCEALLTAATRLSASLGVTFSAELNGDAVGSIADGQLDQDLLEGLLEPWRKLVQRAKG